MKKETGACIDHIGILVPGKKDDAGELLRKLGFCYGNSYREYNFHLMFENCYLEFMDSSILPADVRLPQSAEMEGGHMAFVLGSTDLEKTRDLFTENGYKIYEYKLTNRFAKHGANKGYAAFLSFQVAGAPPFGEDFMMACAQQLNPELISGPACYPHVNDAARLRAVTIVCKDAGKMQATEEGLSQLYNLERKYAVAEHIMDHFILMDAAEYKEEYGAVMDEGKELCIASCLFEGADREYIKIQADHIGVSSFYREGNLYVDLRREIGCFFVFC